MVRRIQSPQRHAFTLVELLVVIAIIAVLLGILLPTIAGVRRAARSTSTQALMRNVRVAIDAFQADNGRAPGYFSPYDMGGAENGDMDLRGFTAMENAILELALPGDSVRTVGDSDPGTAPSMDNTYIDIGPFQTDLTLNVRVNVAEVGTSASGSYLSIGQEHFRAVEGQNSADPTNDLDGERYIGNQLIGMPDIIDYFGQPIMLWQRDTSAELPPVEFADAGTTGDAFGSIFNVDGGSDGKRASFYWASNAGYLAAGGEPDDVNSAADLSELPGLGEDRVNQHLLSCIGASLKNSNAEWVSESLMGAFGAPAFPTDLDPMTMLPLPAQARGNTILHSAGPNAVFFERASTSGRNFTAAEEALDRIGYAPREAAKTMPPLFRTPEDFDDLFEATGG